MAAVEVKKSKLWIVLKNGKIKKDGKDESEIIYYTTKARETPKGICMG